MDNRPIGVIDSGVGGLTVAREFRRLLENENIIYFGDNANVPYGNKTEDEIYLLTKKMIDFLIDKNVKIIAVACNTISSIVDKYFNDYEIPIISIIGPAAKYVSDKKIEEVGLLATQFTVDTASYDRAIEALDPAIKLIAEPSSNLAAVIDGANYSDKEIEDIIDLHMTNILKKPDLKDLILGCTHYPIVVDKFEKRAPGLNFINPALVQVNYIKELMDREGIAGSTKDSRFEIYTSGEKQVYIKMLKTLSMEEADSIYSIDALKDS